MNRLILLAALIAPVVHADVPLEDATKQVCQDHPIKVQCEKLVSSMLVHSYVTGETAIGCELGIVEACDARKHSKHFKDNVRWFNKLLKHP